MAGTGNTTGEAALRPLLEVLDPEPLLELDTWLGGYRAVWQQRLAALHTEIARGKARGEGSTL